ncbi:class II fructose-bisphosphate aldolase [Streptomyces sp. NPDC020917]|uniref:class II fructose-bisphosphate aldolase n=1 Tax=Streptomyces sp. NPDC020917 TaxID=3365102 RepID=UPI0037A329EA
MPLAATGSLLGAAARQRRAVAAFDVVTLDHVQAVVSGAEAADAPVILQIGESAVQYHDGLLLPLARAAAEAARAAAVPVALHLHRVRRTALLAQAAHCGFSSVMYDAAHLPYADHVAHTRDAVSWAHQQGLWAEAEFGRGARTDPAAARAFVAATGVDALAVDVWPDRQLLARLRAAVGVPLVLRDSAGLADEDLGRAAAAGIAKVAIGPALDLAMTAAVRARLAADTAAAPRDWLGDGRRAMATAVTRLLTALPPRLPATAAP